uniref:polysaccharide deacetylase family protein n=1 Tax=Acetatifactor sp. TaxID=1872090 RepID=UPI004057C22D
MQQTRIKDITIKDKVVVFVVTVSLLLSGCAGAEIASADFGGTESRIQPILNEQKVDTTDMEAEAISNQQETQTEETNIISKEDIIPEPIPEDGIGWGLSYGEPETQPSGNVSAEILEQYGAYYMGTDDEKVIYLTFDCGYENGNTEPILDALKKHGVSATFFVVGHFLETEPELVNRMVEEGHAVGSHTYHHPNVATLPDKQAFQEEMDAVRDKFKEVTGKDLAMYYRPPEGICYSENLLMAKEMGYATIFWSLAYVDWDQDKQPDHESAIEKLTTRIHSGAVVLLHNTSKTNGEILDELLTEWEEMGYIVKPLSSLIDV